MKIFFTKGLVLLGFVFCLLPVLAAPDNKVVFVAGIDFVDDDNYLHIFGAVENKTGDWICNVIVDLKILDASGNDLGAVSTTGERMQGATTENYVIAPNEKGYFHFIRDLSKAKGKYKSYQVLNIRYMKGPSNLGSKLENVKIEKDNLGFMVNGVYRNTGKAIIKWPVVIIVGFDSAGRINLVASSGLGDIDNAEAEEVKYLNPGQTASFNTYFLPYVPLKNVVKYIIVPGFQQADGE